MRVLKSLCLLMLCATQSGCLFNIFPPAKPKDPDPVPGGQVAHIIQGCSIDATGPTIAEEALKLAAARNETASAVLHLPNLRPAAAGTSILQVNPLVGPDGQIDPAGFKAYQILPMPVEANRVGFVRHTAQKAASRTMPRALLPLPINAGKIDFNDFRDPSEPLKPASKLGLSKEPALLWLDIPVPATARPGKYKTRIDLIRDGKKVDSVELSLEVYNFVLPDERHLHMVGRIERASLETLYPDLFEAITPHLISRADKKYQAVVKLLDQLVALAQEHRTTVVVPMLSPSVKWPTGQPPLVDWAEFDSLVGPWFSGSAFADKVGLGYWPLPRTQYLDRYPAAMQIQYWLAAAAHFEQRAWADRTWVEIEKDTPRRATLAECMQLSTRAAQLLAAHPRLRVSLPLEDHQLQFQSVASPALLDRADSQRIMSAAHGLVFTPPTGDQKWPAGLPAPKHWLRTDLEGLVPYIGAGGDERDVRLWAWLAFLRQAQVIGWDGALPHSRTPQQSADPNELTWFYPGRWFGVEEPLPTIQLKWLRRSQQDYEYLYLAQQRGQRLYSLVMSRLMIKPVQLGPNDSHDPTYGLLSGTTDPHAWTKAIELLARNIVLREPGTEVNPQLEAQLNTETSQWILPQDKPLQIARTTSWGWASRPGKWVDLRLGLDIYNAADQELTGELSWAGAPHAWEFNPQPIALGPNEAIKTYHVRNFSMDASVDLDRLSFESRKPLQIRFGSYARPGQPSYLAAIIPVVPCDKREGQIKIDGALGDWDEKADGIHTGPLTMLLDRPSVQRQAVQPASTPSSLFANWADRNLYLGFRLEGLAGEGGRTERNFIDYELRRAWGEDLCEILIQPIYVGAGDTGQIIHIVCKPRGQVEISTKPAPKSQRTQGSEFKTLAGPEVRYAATNEGAIWRGELAIPWDLINDKAHQGLRPVLLRYNFVQYKGASGESASWAGPIDFGKDDGFMGLLYLRELRGPGMAP